MTRPVPLGQLAVGEWGRVERLACAEPERLVKLSNLGLIETAIVDVRQRRPAVVIGLGETELALDPEIAAEIWVARLEVKG